MAQLVLAAAGSALGGAFLPTIFGISGASLGYFAGSLLGSALFKPPGQQGPRLDDRTIIGTEFGQAIPCVFGSPRLAGQVVWITNPLREIQNTESVGKGSGPEYTTFTYEGDLLILLTENVTEGVARDWLNGQLVRAGLTLKDGVWDSVTVYTGEEDQLPFPPYEAAVGVGNAPAFRGRTSIGITGFKFGSGKALGNLEHQISLAEIFIDDRIRLLLNWPDASEDDQSNYETGGPETSSGGSVGDGFFLCDYSVAANNFRRYRNPQFAPRNNWPVTYEVLFESLGFNSASSRIVATISPNGEDASGTNSPIELYVSGISGGSKFTVQALGVGASTDINSQDPNDIDTLGLCHYAVTFHDADTASAWFNGVRVRNAVPFNSDLGGTGSGTNAASIILGGSNTTTGTASFRFAGARISRAEPYSGASFTPPTSLNGSLTNASADTFQGRIPLDELISSLMLRAGYSASEFDVSALQDVLCHGYSTGDVTSTRAHLETLRPLGQYEANCSDKIYIFPRATEPAGAIPWSDLGASESPGGGGDPFPIRFDNEIERPAQIALRYKNVTADWNVGTETSERIDASQASTQVAEMAVGMTPAQAKAVVDAMLKDLMAGLGKVTLKVGGRKHAKYEPGDIITVTDPTGRLYRLRILVKRDSVFMIEWECVLDDASALVSPAITYEGYVSTETPIRVAPTDFEVMNLRPLRDADATEPGPYVAVTPLRTGPTDEWPGAVFVRARLPGAYEQEFISGEACVIGECLTTLGTYAKGSAGVQREGKLRVKVMGELSSTTWEDFTADRTINAALVGEREGIRFQIADFVGTDGLFNIYDLSIFLRGQLGEESAIGTHGAGERFVLLNTALRRMVNEVTDIDNAHQVKAVTLNTLLSAVTDLDFTDNAKALRPVSPWRLRALPNASGDMVFTAKRRSRLIARYTETGTFTPLGEATEAYTLRIYDGVTLVRTESLATPAYTYAAADIAADGFTTGDPITFELVQLSETVGDGTAETLTRPAP